MEVIGIYDRWVQYIEKPIIRAVRQALGLPLDYTPECERIIKLADDICCRLEAKCFMTSRGEGWGWGSLSEPPDRLIITLEPYAAEAAFLAAWSDADE